MKRTGELTLREVIRNFPDDLDCKKCKQNSDTCQQLCDIADEIIKHWIDLEQEIEVVDEETCRIINS